MMDELNAEVAHANANRERYEVVSSQTGVPWKAIKAIHYREASNSFKTCLHNGDPLPGPTKHVPKGRGPFNSWETAAVDALLLEKAKFPAVWDLAGTLDFLEKYNGLGYRNHGMVSPYNYAGTTAYVAGLYTDDGVLDKNKVDHRLGCAAILKGLS
jgi:lysozyme family protein